MIGTQEIIALLIVASIVIFALYRRWRKPKQNSAACSGCESPAATDQAEQPLQFYRKQRHDSVDQ